MIGTVINYGTRIGENTMFDPVERDLDNYLRQMDEACSDDQRIEAAQEYITNSLYGAEDDAKAMFFKLGITAEEYREEYDMNPERVAEAHYETILAEWNEEAKEARLQAALNRYE